MISFWDPRMVLRQFTAMIPLPKPGVRGAGRSASRRSRLGPHCGCCPRCRAFLCIEPRH
jgi:hypothetical protein